MKLIIAVAFALVAVAVAAPPTVEDTVLRSDFVQQPEGTYDFSFETSNGIKRQETGELKDVVDEDKKPHKVITVRGSYSYADYKGEPVVINYVADEFGYRAEGDSVPKTNYRR